MTDFIDIILKSNTLNFIIVVIILGFAFSKLNIKKKIENLRDDIASYVEESKSEKETANKELLKSKEALDRVPSDISAIKKDTDNNIKNMEIKIKSETQEQKKDIENNAQRLLDLETKKFKSKLIGILSEKSIELAQNNALEQLSQNKDLHKLYIEEAINELDRISI